MKWLSATTWQLYGVRIAAEEFRASEIRVYPIRAGITSSVVARVVDKTAHTRGRFVTVEGIEGVGKSTNLSFIAGELRRAGHAVIETREPGGTLLGERIRELLLGTDTRIPPLTELLLMFAARAAHLDEVIRPALSRGEWVVCDRFTDASYAYQGGGRGLPAPAIDALAAVVHGELWPDLTLLLDVPLDVSADRQAGRAQRDRFEQESGDFFRRVRQAYLDLAARDTARIRLIDASRPLADVQADIRLALRALV